MRPTHQTIMIAAGLLGFTGVALGAFGAHGLKNALAPAGQLENWKTGVLYQLVHAVALIALANWPRPAAGKIALCWVGGVLLFSGSLYWLALGGPGRFLWPVTPLGGLLLLIGWLLLTWTAWRRTET